MPTRPFEPQWIRNRPWLPVVILAIAALIIFGQAAEFDFTNWDDDEYVTQNLLIQGKVDNALYRIWNEFHYLMYIPITLMSYAIEYQLAGENPMVFHMTNVGLHILNTIGVYLLIRLLTPNAYLAFLSALLFALHPLRVESVAWVSERKDVLYTFFMLAGLYTWVLWRQTNKGYLYIVALICMILSGLSKATAVLMVPYIICLDYLLTSKFTLQRIWDKIPFVLVALGFGWLQLQGISGAVAEQKDVTGYSGIEHILILMYSYVFYIWKTVIPFPLSAYYPLPDKVTDGLHAGYFLAPLVIAAIIAWLVYAYRKQQKPIVFGLLWFTAGVFLFLKLRPGGFFIAGDRYTYSAAIGISIAIALVLETMAKRKTFAANRWHTAILGVLILYALLSFRQMGVWRNSVTLFQDIIRQYPDFYMAYINLGSAHEKEQRYEAALGAYQKALSLNPANDQGWYNAGNVLLALNKPAEALQPMQRAVQVNPRFTKAWNNLGSVWFKLNQYDSAVICYRQALVIEPGYLSATGNLGQALLRQGKGAEALEVLERALKMQPSELVYLLQAGEAAGMTGDIKQEEQYYMQAMSLHAGKPEVYMALGGLYARTDRNVEAVKICDQAIARFPNYADARFNKGVILFQQGNQAEAMQWFQQAADLGHAQARSILAGR
jgi:tetratricopeptide (TPR) repeat protein